ncbi:MAG: chromosome segregation protein SMC [Candidatus Norongarragalinales archaeon]
MYIKKIVLKNFKSFANATVLLEPGFVSLVGPNGSGKTNLIDSLLFAFGESSLKAMRVKRTSDLIHAANPYAEVSVFLEDAAGKTTEIRRAIRRDGKAKYWLNGKRVKKYAVDDFLAANRITLHNVIKQGEVQRIVEMNSKDRRALIDFIANVAEYEQKKTEALGELDKVEARLREARVLSAEREGYLKELEQDKRNAEKFVALDERRKRLKATLLWLELSELEKEFEAAVDLLLDSQNKAAALQKEIAARDDRIAAEHARLDEINKKIAERTSGRAEELQRRIEELTIKIKQGEVAVAARKEALAKAEARAAELRRDKRIAEDEARAADAQLKQLIDEFEAVKRVVDVEAAAVAALNKESESFSQSFKRARETLDKAQAEILECKTRLAALQAEIGKQQEVKNLKQKEFDRLRTGEGIEDYAAKRRELEAEANEERKKLAAAQGEAEKLAARESELDKRIEALNDLILAAQRRIADKEALLRTVGESSSKTAEALRELQKSVKGVHGTIAEICSYSSRHALPIAVALGNRLNYVVVDDVATAGRCIEFLKQTKAGHASFIPLRQIAAPPKIDRALLKRAGVEGEVKDFLEYDERFERAVAFACGGTLVVENFSIGERLVGEARLVTREGELFEASGLVSGGFLTPKANPFLEARELKEWSEKRDDAEREKRDKLAALEKTRGELREARRRAAESELKLKTLELQVQHVNRAEEEALRKKTDLRAALKVLEKEINACDDAIARAEEERASIVRRISELNIVVVEAKQLMDVEKEERFGSSIKEREHKLAELRIELSRKEADAKAMRSRKEVYDRALEKASNELAAVEEEERALREALAAASDEIRVARAELEEKTREQKQIASALEDLFAARDEIDEEIREIGDEKGRLQFALEKISRSENEARVRKGIVETRLGDLKADFEPFREIPLLEGKNSGDKPELAAQLKITEEQIAALGTINLKAIEDYARRAGELAEQKQRIEQLANERQAVLSIIAEVESKKKETFMTAFHAVNENFKRLFKHVFAGEGSLVLENPEAPFEGGLTIKAQLESKQIKYLELMSGGEKSFVALLFLFALQACNPSSVYVLDEADAALDQCNSVKLAELLKKLSRTTQFIVVTHNENVYKAAQALVGVSMGRGGSQIVEVKLTEEGGLSKQLK